MPSLAELTDAYYQDPVPQALPVEQPYLGVPISPDGMRRVYISTPTNEADFSKPITDTRPEPRPEPGLDENPLEVWAKKKSEGASLWDNLGMAGVEDKLNPLEVWAKAKEKLKSTVEPLKDFAKFEQKFTSDVLNFPKKAYDNPDDLRKGLQNLLGGNVGEERYQLWPEKVVREAVDTPNAVMTGRMPTHVIDPETGDVHISPQLIEGAQAVSALAGSGGIGGTGANVINRAGADIRILGKRMGAGSDAPQVEVATAALGSGPSLRPALKYKDRLYKGKEGQQHQDIIPKELYPEFERMAMSGEDISHYNFGFVNDKGQFLTREKALEYGINTGLIDPHAGKYGALTSTLVADSSKPGVAIEAVGKTYRSVEKAPTFYSAVEHNVNAIPQSKMTGEQWLGTLSNKPGVKGEELDWTGLSEFLTENKGKPVTKEQIQEHLAANKVELKEVKKGFTAEAEEEAVDAAKEALQSAYEAMPTKIKFKGEDVVHWNLDHLLSVGHLKVSDLPKELQSLAQKFKDADEVYWNSLSDKPVKYSDYQLPGGENYREMLLTLPENIKSDWKITPHSSGEGYAIVNSKGEYGLNPNGIGEAKFSTPQLAEKSINNYAEMQPSYRSSHWDEPNILAHVRMNDRTIDGKKSLHVEEIQSDWHQQGRDKGYRGDKTLAGQGSEIEGRLSKHLAEKLKLDEYPITHMQKTERLTAAQNVGIFKPEELRTYAEYLKLKGDQLQGVPDAPFKKSWHELALKRMIREAAEKGYDRLSWTPGEAQAARYDLSKQINDLKVVRSVDGSGYTIDGTLKGRSDRTRLGENIPENKLADTVGKEMAQKIKKDIDDAQYNRWGVKNKASGNWSQRFKSKAEAEEYQKTLPESIRGKTDVLEMTPKYAAEYSGLDLKVGGEGMKGFYDQIIPKALEKLGKEHGVKVKTEYIANKEKEWPFPIRVASDGKNYWLEGKDPRLDHSREVSLSKKFDSFEDADKLRERFYKGETEPVHYIDIPPSLKETALGKGFPLFSNGYMLVPVQGNPFESKEK